MQWISNLLVQAIMTLALCTVSMPAFAQGAGSSGSAQSAPVQNAPKSLAESLTGDALSDYEGGKLLVINGDFASALIKFQHAYELSKDPRLLWNMAVCYKETRRYTRMLATLKKMLDEGGSVLTDQDKKDANDAIEAVQAFVSPLKLSINEAGATVFVDDESVGTTPLSADVLVDVGSRKIRVSKPGFKDFVRTVVVAGARDVTMMIRLEKELHIGRLAVVAGPNDLISLDGKAVGKARWEGQVKSGGHTLRVTAPGMTPYQSEVLVKDNEVRRVQISLNPVASDEVARWLWIAGGTILVTGAVITGVVLAPESKPAVQGTIDPPSNIPLRFRGF